MTYRQYRPSRPRPPGSRRPSPIFLALLAAMALSGLALGFLVGPGTAPAAGGLAVFAFVVSGWVVSLCLHEYAHARTALAAGDHSVEVRGYLTLDPRRYVNPLLSIILPVVFVILGGIGLPGGSVYIERGHIPGRVRHSLVSAAGPATNALFAAVLLLPLSPLGARESLPGVFAAALAFLGFLQISAAILNLIPVPGLDGYGIVEPWLPHGLRTSVVRVAPFGLLIVFGLLWVPAINEVFFQGVYGVFGWFDVPEAVPEVGRYLFRFWNFLGSGGGGPSFGAA